MGKLPALRGWYFGWYYDKVFCLAYNLWGIPFLNNLAGTPMFLKKGASMHQKVGQCPPFE
jgi:hypothetical protein